ncbi:tRNA pseudouridine32 synthase / 23S rRNA pseudouridine746 synthase [Thalassolituus maritimus]|uniref:tRNA pseudouridine32 synthase / 23S rRNA pseudouridine746 synthase n=1 Tax=Thalassolituus maritimus TaxID=484498 RepID=A0A1N7KSJ5_9GAMM|nr:TIGR01621 family pseudouridine synthase [Thalassolituus maritimus]SIS64592.1 tRNA pseudouridine32 synthase / 23S rRNA pseudouridine746 synthase [Thalassolituus maritimus]
MSESSATEPSESAPTVIAQGQGWLVLDKPAGQSFHSEDGEPGFFAAAEAALGQKLWPVHRLDKVTSGLVLVATSTESAAFLSQQFAERTTSKYYLALSRQRPKKKQGIIKGDMGKARNGSYRLLRTLDNPAITRFWSRFDTSGGERLFLLKPHTGKTHQLRVAMKSLGAPILGDTRYGGDQADRTYLHAWALEFNDGQVQQRLFSSPSGSHWPDIPDDWHDPFTDF